MAKYFPYFFQKKLRIEIKSEMLVTKFRHLFLVRPIITIFVDPTNRERSGEDEREQQSPSIYCNSHRQLVDGCFCLQNRLATLRCLRTDTGVGHYRYAPLCRGAHLSAQVAPVEGFEPERAGELRLYRPVEPCPLLPDPFPVVRPAAGTGCTADQLLLAHSSGPAAGGDREAACSPLQVCRDDHFVWRCGATSLPLSPSF